MENHFVLQHNWLEVVKLAFYDVFVLGDSSYNPVLWTMRIELIGSVLIFILLPMMVLIKNIYVRYAIGAVFMLLVFSFIGIHFVAFILGVILCNMHYNEVGIFRLKGKWFTASVLIIGIVLGSFPYTDTTNTMYQVLEFSILGGHAFVFYHIVGAFFIMIALLNSNLLQNVFSKGVFYFLGKISFSLYLTHFLILCSFSAFIFRQLSQLNLSYNLTFILTVVPSILLMFGVAYVMYKYVDSLSIKVSSAIYKKLFKRVYETSIATITSEGDKVVSK